MSKAQHVPVMLDRVLHFFETPLSQKNAVFVDCTLGLGGHTEAILNAFPQAHGFVFDRDPQAMALAKTRLAQYRHRLTYCAAVFDEYHNYVTEPPAAVLADLGLSSLQIDQLDRGFSYSQVAPLDMRMSGTGTTAAEILNTFSEAELAEIIYFYGEEPQARRIAKKIVANRPLNTSDQLVGLLDGMQFKRRGHPAKRIFQALRIAVNDELTALDSLLTQVLESLGAGGRFAVLSYHSLEDRRVKHQFRSAAEVKLPRGVPYLAKDMESEYRILTKGAERPDEKEITNNPRAASARLRVIERSEIR